MKNNFSGLVAIMKRLRAKNGCPWDRKQTHKTLLPYLIEESYELIEAINKKDKKEIKEELGDVLLQVVFHSQIASEKEGFTIEDVVAGINEKLISRHPHVFAGKKGITKDYHVKAMWEKDKKETKKRDSVTDGIPKAMPALLRARRLQSKVVTTGFKWKTKEAILKKVDEELAEVRGAIRSKNRKHVEEEIGDLIFTLVALAYFLKIDPENALQNTNEKFIRRFKKIEKRLYPAMPEREMLALWRKTKMHNY
jgi:tetrapyrrole methylase family protein / MazG family protein